MSSGRTSTRPEPAPGSVSEADSQDYSEAYTDELIERILDNYEFKCQPELRFKLKHKCASSNAPASVAVQGCPSSAPAFGEDSSARMPLCDVYFLSGTGAHSTAY